MVKAGKLAMVNICETLSFVSLVVFFDFTATTAATRKRGENVRPITSLVRFLCVGDEFRRTLACLSG